MSHESLEFEQHNYEAKHSNSSFKVVIMEEGSPNVNVEFHSEQGDSARLHHQINQKGDLTGSFLR